MKEVMTKREACEVLARDPEAELLHRLRTGAFADKILRDTRLQRPIRDVEIAPSALSRRYRFVD